MNIPRFNPSLNYKDYLSALNFLHKNSLQQFEDQFATFADQKYAIAFPYGRSAIYALMHSLGLKNQPVMCPAYTCVVVPNAIVTSNNYPLFIDSQEDANMNLDIAFASRQSPLGAIISTSIFGQPVDLDKLKYLSKAFPEAPIIQDCAHSYLCEWNRQPVHKHGLAAIYGLNVSKIVTSIFGGVVTTNNGELARRLYNTRDSIFSHPSYRKAAKRLSYLFCVSFAFSKTGIPLFSLLRKYGLLDSALKYYDPYTITMPSDFLEGMTNLEARVGINQLSRYKQFIEARRRYAALYHKNLSNHKDLKFLPRHDGATYSQIVATVDDRKKVTKALDSYGIELGEVLEYCIPNLPAYHKYRPTSGSWPVAEYLSKHVINLPVSNTYDEKKAHYVVQCFQSLASNQ